MIHTTYGNLLQLVSSGHIVHGVNCQGIMGKGFAKELKEIHFWAYLKYRKAFDNGDLHLGNVISADTSKLVIHNACTQEYFGSSQKQYVDYNAIKECMININEKIKYDNIHEQILHFPMLGAGLGGGNWDIISDIIDRTIEFPKRLYILQKLPT